MGDDEKCNTISLASDCSEVNSQLDHAVTSLAGLVNDIAGLSHQSHQWLLSASSREKEAYLSTNCDSLSEVSKWVHFEGFSYLFAPLR